jgi:hypothetical protein
LFDGVGFREIDQALHYLTAQVEEAVQYMKISSLKQSNIVYLYRLVWIYYCLDKVADFVAAYVAQVD